MRYVSGQINKMEKDNSSFVWMKMLYARHEGITWYLFTHWHSDLQVDTGQNGSSFSHISQRPIVPLNVLHWMQISKNSGLCETRQY